MRVLITGAGGMLAQDVCAAAAGHEVIAVSHAALDITDALAVETVVSDAAPDAVINCAAWTDVDGAEAAAAQAHAVNGEGAGNVARAASNVRAHVVHVSSDYVFDGAKQAPYLESDPVRPLSVYGHSKLAGERAVAEAAPERNTIVRSAWLFGASGRCFPATILRLARERGELKVVDDQVGSPTFTGHLAQGLIELCHERPGGLLHVAGAGHCSWFELAREVLSCAQVDCRLEPVTTSEMPRPAPRPAFSALDSERDEAPRLADWRQGVREYLAVAVGAS